MKKPKILIILIIGLTIYSCSTVPITGRKQLNMIPDNELMTMSFQQYNDFLKENPLSSNEEQSFYG